METLLLENKNGILTITINRPEKLNALNASVLRELEQAIDDARTNPEVHGIILTGSGPKAFVAGADITEFMGIDTNDAAALAKRGQDILLKIETCPKPVIAAVNGFALGGGCELAMSCHIRMASTHAKFGQPEVNLGIIPGYGGTQRLPRLVGRGLAMELMMSGNMIDAQEAYRIGLVNHITEPDQLILATENLLLTILSKSPQAVAKVIAAVHAGYEGTQQQGYDAESQLFGTCAGTAEMKEGVSAFLEKRKAEFRK